MDLPENVLEALRRGQKIDAIKLLRRERGIGLKEAKDLVDQYTSGMGKDVSRATVDRSGTITRQDVKRMFPAFLVIAAFVWAMINFVEVVGSIIVLWHQDGYQEATFVIDKVHFRDDPEAGLTWGFIGRIHPHDTEIRMYAPKLADAKMLGYQGLRRIYPVGMQMQILHNPDVTDTLFQQRTLQIIPYTSNLADSEMDVIYRWLLYCFLPLVIVMWVVREK